MQLFIFDAKAFEGLVAHELSQHFLEITLQRLEGCRGELRVLLAFRLRVFHRDAWEGARWAAGRAAAVSLKHRALTRWKGFLPSRRIYVARADVRRSPSVEGFENQRQTNIHDKGRGQEGGWDQSV
jgi:hypothetical protein